jgi:hypothetical protein
MHILSLIMKPVNQQHDHLTHGRLPCGRLEHGCLKGGA